MSLYPLFPLPLFHTPGPFQKGRADAPMAYPLASTISSHAATASSPLQRGWGYVPILPLDFIPPTPFKRGGLAHPWHTHWQAPYTPTPPPRSPLFRGAGGMPLYPLLPLTPLPLFHTPGPFQKGRADAFIIFPSIDTSESSHAATAVSPLQRGWGYVPPSSTPSNSSFSYPRPLSKGEG